MNCHNFPVLVVVMMALTSAADDWPQFGRMNRNSKSAETGLLKKWPAEGPKLLLTIDRIVAG